MRSTRPGPLCAAALMLAACGSNETEAVIAEEPVPELAGSPSVAVVAPAPEPAPAPAPAHGGTVVTAGPQHVEVLPHDDGTVHAFIVTPSPPPPEQTELTVRMQGDDGQLHPVLLTWDPGEERYRGVLRGPRPAPGPVEVVLVVGAQRYEGRAPQIIVLAAPASPEVHVVQAEPRQVVVERPSSPGVVVVAPQRPGVVVHRPGPPTVVVHRPGPPTVVVHRPGPPTVVVHRPGPPGVVIQGSGPRGRIRHDNGRHLGHRGGNPGRGHGGRGHVRVHRR